MAINPNVTGSTADPKWIDGGPENFPTEAQPNSAAVQKTFNVDVTTMWPPLSVISGLMSGFCERAAYVSAMPHFPEGMANWTKEADNTGRPVNASNAEIVDHAVNNIANCGGISTLFTAQDSVVGKLPGTIDPPENYMKAFDSALCVLITSNGGYKTITGGTFTFDTLATAAKTRADAANSSIEEPVFGGGTHAVVFNNAYPGDWAEERKWMLDELNYTSRSPLVVIDTINVQFPKTANDDNLHASAVMGVKTEKTLYEEMLADAATIASNEISALGDGANVSFEHDSGTGKISTPDNGQTNELPFALDAVYQTLADDATDPLRVNDQMSFYLDTAPYLHESAGKPGWREANFINVESNTVLTVTDAADAIGYQRLDQLGYAVLTGGTLSIIHVDQYLYLGACYCGLVAGPDPKIIAPDGRVFPVIADINNTGRYWVQPDKDTILDYVGVGSATYDIAPLEISGSTYNVLYNHEDNQEDEQPVYLLASNVTRRGTQIDVSSGGVLSYPADARFGGGLNIMTGGTVQITGLVNGNTIHEEFGEIYLNYQYADNPTEGADVVVITGTTTLNNVDNTYLLYGPNCSVTFSGSPDLNTTTISLRMMNGAKCTISGRVYTSALIGSGCTCTAEDVTEANIVATIAPGGVFSATSCGNCSVEVFRDGCCVLESTATNMINMLDGATVTITGATLHQEASANDNTLITGYQDLDGENNDHGYSSNTGLRMALFNPFGLAVQRGWNYYSLRSEDISTGNPARGSCVIVGTTVFSDAKTSALATAVVDSVEDFSGLHGTITVGNTNYTWQELLPIVRSAQIWENMRALALNGGTVTRCTVQPHYSSFRCRQFYQDPDEATT